MKRSALRPALLAAAALALAPPAARAVPTEPHSFTHTAGIPARYVGTSATADLTDFAGSILLPQIAPAGGARITSITVALSGGVFGAFSATNPTSSPNERTYYGQTAEVSATITVSSPGGFGTPLGVVLPLVSRAFDLAPQQTVSEANLAGYAGATRTTDASSPNFDAFAPLFLGAGTVALPVSAVGSSRFTGSGNVRFAADTLAGATATITVDYLTEAAPRTELREPAGLALLGGGLIGMAALRRKRKRA